MKIKVFEPEPSTEVYEDYCIKLETSLFTLSIEELEDGSLVITKSPLAGKALLVQPVATNSIMIK